jgi:iron complex transport system ATP-binding protein
LLLLDEPTSALDLSHQHSLMQLLRARAAAGMGAVVAVHDLNLAARYGDRILMMKAGKVAALGTPEEILVPATVESVFGVKVSVIRHPEEGFPLVVV